MRTVGLHLRIDHSLTHTARFAHELGMRSFQCFVSLQANGKCFVPDQDDVQNFNAMRSHFDTLFLHASYFINPASCSRTHHPILQKEIEIATQLNIPYLILHPGMAVHNDYVDESIDALARVIDAVHGTQELVSIVLENTAQESRAIGSNFDHLKMLLNRVDDPERLRFCIDTAHAFAYGYDISDLHEHPAIIELIDQTIGIERVVVIHLNDTLQPLASFMDEHATLGTGLIGAPALQAFVNHQKLAHIPLILELPLLSDNEYRQIIQLVTNW